MAQLIFFQLMSIIKKKYANQQSFVSFAPTKQNSLDMNASSWRSERNLNTLGNAVNALV